MNGKPKIVSAGNLFYYSALLLAFFIPSYKRIAPYIIAVFMICWIVSLIMNRKSIKFEYSPLRLFCLVLYGIYAFSMIYTANTASGLFDLEVKLSIFLFPLVFSFSGNSFFPVKRFSNILLSFLAGTFVTTLVCLSIAVYRSYSIFFTHDFFMYTYLADFLHPSYLAMFINLAVAIAASRLVERWNTSKLLEKTGFSLLVLYFAVFIFLLDSKAGIIVLFLNLAGIFLFYFLQKIKIWKTLVFAAAIIAVGFLTVRVVPVVSDRFTELIYTIKNVNKIDPNTENDSQQRILIWKNSARVISKNWVLGVGTGDVNVSLAKEYCENGFNIGVQRKLNCHNQFLQTFVATGIAGFALLLLVLFFTLRISIKKRDVVLFSFFIIICCNMLFESILETQAGTVFFGFFIAFMAGTSARTVDDNAPVS